MASYTVKLAVQRLGKLLVEEDRYLYTVSEKIERLQTELAWIECLLREADTLQHQEKVISKWLSQVRDLAYSSEEILESYLHEINIHHQQDTVRENSKWFSCIYNTSHHKLDKLHELGLKVDDLRKEIVDLSHRLQGYGITVIKPKKVDTSREKEVQQVEEKVELENDVKHVVGFEKDIQQVVAQLRNQQVNVVMITGIGGSGKSTLARKVYEDFTMPHFDCRAWIYISKVFDTRKVLEEILTPLRVYDVDKLKELTNEELSAEINDMLQSKKCFLVLDDIWTTTAWNGLKPALGMIKGSPSKILLTTRNKCLIDHVDSSGYLHRLGALNDEDSWKLFRVKAFPRSTGIL